MATTSTACYCSREKDGGGKREHRERKKGLKEKKGVKERWGWEYTGNENAYAVVYFLYLLWLDNVLGQLGCGYTNTNML